MKKQARFWTYINGAPVMIKLAQGQTLQWSERHATDEGWSSEAMAWSFDGEGVTCEYFNDGCDCDGRLSSGGEDYCALDMLRTVPGLGGVIFPAWNCTDDYRRDYQAEAAGY